MRYATIVADPPWQYGKSNGFAWRAGAPSGERGPMLTYPTLSVGEIAELPVEELADTNAHLYVWTTQRYIWETRGIIHAWGFEPSTILTWCKPPTGFSLGGAFGKSSEFCVFARRGSLRSLTRTNRDWWEWSRGEHSAKPEAFLDIVEQVSPGPYLEMFARRNRLGWDTWGNEALEHVALPAVLREPKEYTTVGGALNDGSGVPGESYIDESFSRKPPAVLRESE